MVKRVDEEGFVDIKKEIEEQSGVLNSRNRRRKIRRNLFYTFLILGFITLIFTPGFSTLFEIYTSPDSQNLKANWFENSFAERIDQSVNYSMKHWYFYFIPAALFASMSFFAKSHKEGVV
ncbi:hypothetical protein GOV14_03785 [Candidatus Pacearchaeota archaeon]|nr:hypothetical protein [Candidatus Pacearchaeota archaeon]